MRYPYRKAWQIEYVSVPVKCFERWMDGMEQCIASGRRFHRDSMPADLLPRSLAQERPEWQPEAGSRDRFQAPHTRFQGVFYQKLFVAEKRISVLFINPHRASCHDQAG
jgi:hypothetical protein